MPVANGIRETDDRRSVVLLFSDGVAVANCHGFGDVRGSGAGRSISLLFPGVDVVAICYGFDVFRQSGVRRSVILLLLGDFDFCYGFLDLPRSQETVAFGVI